MSEEEKYIINPITGDKILSTKFIVEDYYRKCDELQVLKKCNNETNELANEYKKKIDKVVKIINKALCPNSDYVDYDFGSELLRQELLEVLEKGENKK